MNVFVSGIDTAKLYLQFFFGPKSPQDLYQQTVSAVCGFIEVSIYTNKTLTGLLRELKNKGKVQLGNLKGSCGCSWEQSFARAFHLNGQVHRSVHAR